MSTLRPVTLITGASAGIGRELARVNGKLVNTIIKTYPQVSQFWTYDPKAFVQQPVFSRDFPPSKYLE